MEHAACTELDRVKAWITGMDRREREQLDAQIDAERGALIRAESPQPPPETSNEVLGHMYRLATAQAILNIYRRRSG